MSGDDGSVTGAPSHHQVAAIASAVSASATRADPIAFGLGMRDTPLALTLKPGAAKMQCAKRQTAASPCTLDKRPELE